MTAEVRKDKEIISRILKKQYIAWLVVVSIVMFGVFRLIEGIDKTSKILSDWSTNEREIQNVDSNSINEMNTKPSSLFTIDSISKISSYNTLENVNNYEFSISSIVTDLNGIGLGNVEIYCRNCLNNSKVTSNSSGSYVLTEDLLLKDKSIQSVEICYKYFTKIKCISPNYKYLNNINSPKFERK